MTGPFWSGEEFSVVWYRSHNSDKSALGLVINSDFAMSSLNARM